MKILIAIVVFMFFECAWTWSKGTKRFDGQPCIEMKPNHGNKAPQITDSPFSVKVSKLSVRQGENVNVVIEDESGNLKFQGFAIEAQTSAPSSIVIGTFLPTDTAKIIECDGNASAATQNGAKRKDKIELIWKAPSDYLGDFRFNATVVKSFSYYWLNVITEWIEVTV
ncbi:CLUMA_CG009267, isoform A [Clunio marinus]|uniref:CLUMA_CG009267, isoform A n=1 Tax=Clunio marinus TaxID=568069 RepID=A0A1J1I667_9DIPT|nr:CLUMA_CG009267, isoform A [Clunio marinus]